MTDNEFKTEFTKVAAEPGDLVVIRCSRVDIEDTCAVAERLMVDGFVPASVGVVVLPSESDIKAMSIESLLHLREIIDEAIDTLAPAPAAKA